MNQVNRRTVLQGAAAGALAALLTQGTSWAATKPLAPPAHPLVGGKVADSPDPTPPGPAGSLLAPYTAVVSTTLSQDYFSTTEVLLGGERILPFERPGGAVEALVFSGSAINYLQKDPTSSSGWAYSAVPFPDDWFPLGPLYDCAVQLGSDGSVYCVFTQQDTYNDGGYLIVNWMALPPGGTSWNVLDAATPEEMPSAIGPLGSSSGLNGEAYFYAVNGDGTALLWQPQAWFGGPSTVITGLPAQTFSSAALLWNPGWNSSTPTWQQGAIIATTGSQSDLYQQNGSTSVGAAQTFYAFASIPWLGWAAVGGQTPQGPGYVAQGSDGVVLYSDGISGQWPVSALSVVAGQAAVWSAGDLVSAALLTGTTATVVTQWNDDPQDIAFTTGIPICGDLIALTGCPTDPGQGTLFVTDSAGTLQVLSRDPSTQIWSKTPVHQSIASTYEIDTWRVSIELTDSNGILLSGCKVTVTPDQAIGIWQPGGSTDADPNTPFTTTTDEQGRVVLAVAATEVDAPMLSVQVFLDDAASGPPIPVNPAQNVHNFFAGTGTIDGVGTLTSTDGSALLSATGPAGALFPVLTNIADPTQQSQAAAAVGAALNQSMAAATAGVPGPNDTQSFTLDFTSGTPAYSSSTSPNPSVGMHSSGWFTSAEHDLESVYHGIRHGLISVEHCAASFVSKAAGWAVNLAITIGDDISDNVSYAITDLRSAIHAISGFLSKLGADIRDVISWLSTNIKETFQSAAANTRTLIGWMSNIGTELTAALTQLQGLEQGWFTGRETAVNAALNSVVIPGTGGWTLGDYSSSVPNPPAGPRSGGGQPSLPEKIALDVVHVWHDASGGWLLDKIRSEFNSQLQTPGGSDPVTAALNNLIGIVTGTDWLINIGTDIWQTFTVDSAAHFDSLESLAFATVLQLIQRFVDQVLQLMDQAVTAVIALAEAVIDEWVDMLQTNLLQLPLISEILSWLGIDLQLEVGHIFGMILMFPTTIAYRIAHGGNGTMFTAPTAGAVSRTATADQLADDLIFAHACLRGVNSIADAIADMQVYDDPEDNPSRLTPLKWVGYFDTVAKAAINVVTYPGQKNPDGTTAEPFTTAPPDPTVNSLNAQVFSKMLLSWLTPLLSGGAQIGKAAGLNRAYTAWQPYVSSLVGAASFGLGIAINVEKGSPKILTASGALENVPSMLSPLAVQALNDGLFDVPLGVKLFIDMVLEPIAAALIANT